MFKEKLDEITHLLEKQRIKDIKTKAELEQLKQAQENLQMNNRYENQTENLAVNKEDKHLEYNPEDEMEYYINNLASINSNTPEIIMKGLLPSVRNKNAINILLRLKLECIKNMREINEVLSEINDIPKEDLLYFQQELKSEEKKLSIINKRLSPEQQEEKIQEEVPENKLIFVPTVGGNIRILEELKNIPQEYYERFYGLFSSIKDSTFKNVKSFKRLNNNTPLFCEVKDTAVRVMFSRLGPQEYAVITCFIKKTDNNKGYRNQLEQKMNDYKQIEPILIANLGNEEFIERNKMYENTLWEMIKPREERGEKKQYVRTKASDYRRNTTSTK